MFSSKELDLTRWLIHEFFIQFLNENSQGIPLNWSIVTPV